MVVGVVDRDRAGADGPGGVLGVGWTEISGRSGTILEGESGANDPVGIALMVSLLTVSAAGVSGGSAVVGGVGSFLVQMMVGAAGASPVGGA